MRKFIKISFLLTMFAFVAMNVQAQKFGYIDSQALLAEMPRAKQAQANLEIFEKQLTAKIETRMTAFQTKQQELYTAQQQGTITAKNLEAEAKKLEAKQQEIVALQQDLTRQFEERRVSELQPIYDDINSAIKSVAKENGYQFIFEKASLLYTDDSTDVSALVKTKLNM